MPTPQSSYLVCATHRSGSNLLCMGLWHSDLAGRPQEFLSPTREEKLALEHGLTLASESYTSYLHDALEQRQTPNGVFGTKIMWKHLEHFQNSLMADPAFLGPQSENPWHLLQAALPQPRCLWIERRNTVRQAISMVKAKQTRIYNSMQLAERKPRAQAVYDGQSIAQEKARFEKENQQWQAFFEANQIEAMKVVYEDFAQDYVGTIARVLDFLQIERPQPFELRKPDYQPQSDALNEEWERRFAQGEI